MWQNVMQNVDTIDIHPTTTQNTDMYIHVRMSWYEGGDQAETLQLGNDYYSSIKGTFLY